MLTKTLSSEKHTSWGMKRLSLCLSCFSQESSVWQGCFLSCVGRWLSLLLISPWLALILTSSPSHWLEVIRSCSVLLASVPVYTVLGQAPQFLVKWFPPCFYESLHCWATSPRLYKLLSNGSREMALASLPEDPGFVPSTHPMVVHNPLSSSSNRPNVLLGLPKVLSIHLLHRQPRHIK